jgi:hypothetical protein
MTDKHAKEVIKDKVKSLSEKDKALLKQLIKQELAKRKCKS